jgi:hypothetical protein
VVATHTVDTTDWFETTTRRGRPASARPRVGC